MEANAANKEQNNMRDAGIKTLAIFIFLIFCLSECSIVVRDRRVRVSIVNRLGNGRTMNIHCQSRDDDLGYLRIPDGYETEWSFNVNIWGTTLFYCDVQWGDSEWLHFDAYSYKSDSGRCDTVCRWMVAEDGLLYVYNQENEKWEHMPFQDML
ncbi:unnamed protein product [Ilex paraguariensis]|uniref:S-protein homolog n=1 Tax=Ilex paraguariensis TaxID=185542 RepID=A0ABC8QTY8_9AQUA